MLGGSQWVHCGSLRRSQKRWSARSRRRIFHGNGSTIWIHTRSVSWFGCRRAARRSTSTFTSCRSWSYQFTCSPSRGRHWGWNWQSLQTSSGMTKFTDSPRFHLSSTVFLCEFRIFIMIILLIFSMSCVSDKFVTWIIRCRIDVSHI